eukprot:Nitzschia sp. Nitz4//scaffold372_size14277//10216//11418//NITZ4_008944-RA/size14277-processed-gene-0.7-mRNA-1//1//CDS//3329549594//5405//frame0
MELQFESILEVGAKFACCSTITSTPLSILHDHDNVLDAMASRFLSLADLPLRPSTLTLLNQRGYETVGDVLQAKQAGGVSALAEEWQVSTTEALRIWEEIRPQSTNSATADTEFAADSAANLWKPPQSIVTFSSAVDELLGGGIPMGSLTEIAGLPGVGKTQLAMQLAVLAHLPRNLGGVQGQTLYIDSEGSLVPERLSDMAEALVRHVQWTTTRRRQHPSATRPMVPTDWTPQQIMESIHVFRVHDLAAQTATLHSLPYWMQQIPNVRLIVVDSLAFHYRSSNTSTHPQRTQTITQLASFLSTLARDHQVAVVCINHMTTAYKNGGHRPALGETWAHAVSTRLILHHQPPHKRWCSLVKSPYRPSGKAYFRVSQEGIRGALPEDSNENTPPDAKRVRTN